MLEHLKALQDANLDLTESMQRKLEVLLAKQQNGTMIKPLNHGHLNRLRKIKTQVNNAGKRIAELDQEWSSFVDKTMSKVKEHASMYQSCRADMLENLQQEASRVRISQKRAQHSLDADAGDRPTRASSSDSSRCWHADAGNAGGRRLGRRCRSGGSNRRHGRGRRTIGDRARTECQELAEGAQRFSGVATSPTKVANQHLKIKSHDSKENKAKD